MMGFAICFMPRDDLLRTGDIGHVLPLLSSAGLFTIEESENFVISHLVCQLMPSVVRWSWRTRRPIASIHSPVAAGTIQGMDRRKSRWF
jgi:hypothetical protein